MRRALPDAGRAAARAVDGEAEGEGRRSKGLVSDWSTLRRVEGDELIAMGTTTRPYAKQKFELENNKMKQQHSARRNE